MAVGLRTPRGATRSHKEHAPHGTGPSPSLAGLQAASTSSLSWHLSLKAKRGVHAGNLEMFKEVEEKLGEGSRLGLDLSLTIARTLSFPDQLD